jgi:hypothetical protein
MYQREMLRAMDEELNQHPKYLASAKFLKRTSRKILCDNS